MNARLTYLNPYQDIKVTFTLTKRKTVVGRKPQETLYIPELAAKIDRREAFSIVLDDTLFIAIPSELRLAKNHFVISQLDENGQSNYWIEDLKSHCGFMLNDRYDTGKKKIRLKSGDRIHYGFQFEFDVDQST